MRSTRQKIIDFATFPARAVLPVQESKWGMTSRPDERFEYASQLARGRVLDIGCGRNNTFIERHAPPGSVGIDVFAYEGLQPEQIVEDMTHLPFDDATFDTVTFIANLNHIPVDDREPELREAFRVLSPGGRVIATMGSRITEVLIHRLVHFYDQILGTKLDMDGERGMHEDEEFHLSDDEIRRLLAGAGFVEVRKVRFTTQWGLNHLFVGTRP
jgi:ubiquinone/menaquinone biosynthesis C-methylase UbiE